MTREPSDVVPSRDRIETVGDALTWGGRVLSAITYRPHTEAERLLAHVLRKERTALLAHPEWAVTSSQAEAYAEAVAERTDGTPLPYILGHVAFFGLDLLVTPDVLIPRPETELLVERAAHRLRTHGSGITVDVGTGSGCIAVALAHQHPGTRVIALDLSMKALRVAQANSRRHGVAEAVTPVRGDLLTPLGRPLDLILSNPPYVADREWQTLPYSVRREPVQALLAGPEGLDAIARLLAQARVRLAPEGCILIEIGETQGNAVRAMARTAFPEAAIAILPDLAGKDRLLQILT